MSKCNHTQLDFSVIDDCVRNGKFLTIMDTSCYANDVISMPIIDIKFPGFNDKYKAPFLINSVNKITTSFLEFTKEPTVFPDGLYWIQYSIEPALSYSVCKWHLRTVETKCNIAKLLEEVSLANKGRLDQLYELDKWLWAAQEEADRFPNQANEMFKYVQSKVNSLLTCTI